jgi:outer membrane lipoprotein-sorting protein
VFVVKWASKSLFLAFLLTFVAAFAQPPDPQPEVAQIVSRMLAAQSDARSRMRPYQAVRQYQIFKGNEQKTAVTAEVTYLPPQEKSFNITKSTGGTGERVVKKALEHEVVATKSPREYEISPENYEFSYTGEGACHNTRCYILTINPKRDCKDLIEGRIWVDKDTFLIHKLEGELAKSPSWWVKKAQVMVEYGKVEGMWLQTRSVADAKMRMIGDYRMISRDINLRAGGAVAASAKPNNNSSFRRRLSAGALVGDSALFLPRK